MKIRWSKPVKIGIAAIAIMMAGAGIWAVVPKEKVEPEEIQQCLADLGYYEEKMTVYLARKQLRQ